MEVKLVDATVNPITKIANCAREAYQSFDNKKLTDEQLVSALLSSGDTSPFEHAYITFRITGVSRIATHQIVRHRIASYTQESQKYVTQLNEFVTPEGVDGIAKFLIEKHYKQSVELYNELVNAYGLNKDIARYVLPGAKSSNIVVTMNFRSLLNLFRQRTCGKASVEIQRIALAMKDVAENVCKEIFQYDDVPCHDNDDLMCPKGGKCNRVNK